jgi:hypothetical protein
MTYKKGSLQNSTRDIHPPAAPRGKSEGERLIQRILERELGLLYERDYLMEHVFEDMGRRLRFDFYVRIKPFTGGGTDKILLIEFDGDQHYSGSRFHRTRTEWLDAIERDEIKNQYCREKGLSLLRVPQSLCKHLSKFTSLIVDFVDKVRESDRNIIDVDLYFKMKAGKLTL